MKSCLVVDSSLTNRITDVAAITGGLYNPRDEIISWVSDEGYFVPREQAENDESIKQIIPVVVFVDEDTGSIVLYQRQAKHTEQRLAGKWTCAFGGHIDKQDTEGMGDLVEAALRREIKEETGLVVPTNNVEFSGYIYDNKDAVGRVHLGLLFKCYMSITPEILEMIKSKEEIADVRLLSEEGVFEQIYYHPRLKTFVEPLELEGWAKIILKALLVEDND